MISFIGRAKWTCQDEIRDASQQVKKEKPAFIETKSDACPVEKNSHEGALSPAANSAGLTSTSPSAQAAEHPDSQTQKKNIRQPDQKLRVKLRIRAQGIGDDNEKKIEDANDKARGEAKGGLAALSGDSKGHADEGEDDAGHRKRKPFVDFSQART